jgi:protocatechuate 3,4-dioxygenase beta subunit
MGGYIQRDWRIQPAALSPDYKSTVARAPRLPLLALPGALTDMAGPVFRADDIGSIDNDLIQNYAKTGAPIGERIVVHGRLLDQDGHGVPGTLIEVWQANAGGRYQHVNDDYLAAIDPNFGGCGRTLTGADGRYWLRTIKPGACPFRNFANSWRPAHIHFSLFGTGWAQRLITQMYFEGDPLLRHDAIAQTIPDAAAVERLTAALDLDAATPLDCLAYRFDIVLRGHRATFFENKRAGN